MSYIPNSYIDKDLVLYLRPVDNVPDFEIMDAAKWFAATKRSSSAKKAYGILHAAKFSDEAKFRQLMSLYYQHNSKSYYEKKKQEEREKKLRNTKRHPVKYGLKPKRKLSPIFGRDYTQLFGR
jgi:hypothetical protein